MLIPEKVIIEVTNSCNLRCKGCPFHGENKIVNKQVSYFQRDRLLSLLDEIEKFYKPVNVVLHGGGEPLLYKNYYDILSYAKSKRNVRVGFLTNGTINFYPEKLIAIGVDWVGFSLDGATPENYKKIRNFSLNKVEQNINSLIRLKNRYSLTKPEIYLNMVLYNELLKEKKDFLRKWLFKTNAVMISKFREPSEKRWEDISIQRRACYHLFTESVIDSSGNMVLCCEDYNSEYIMGNVYNNSILEIFNNHKFKKAREVHFKKDFSKIPLCNQCDTWADNILKKYKYKNLIVDRSIVQNIYKLF